MVFSFVFYFQRHALDESKQYSYRERSSLLLLAMKWYHQRLSDLKSNTYDSSISTVDDTSVEVKDRLMVLEKKVWIYQIKAEVERSAVEVGSLNMFVLHMIQVDIVS